MSAYTKGGATKYFPHKT